jgi:AcrR family transcriptional regulator
MSAQGRPARDRRNEILAAAAEVIGGRGLADTRISDVADRAGTSAALIIYYFETKDRLLTQALAFAEDRFYLHTRNELAELDSARARLERLIELSLPPEAGPAGIAWDWTLWLELWSRALRDGGTARKREALDRRWRATIADIVREGRQSGEFTDIHPDAFALHLSALLDGLSIQLVLHDREVTLARARLLCDDLVRRELGVRIISEPGRAPQPKPAGARGRRALDRQ